MISDVHKAAERGHFNFGWLDTRHSFSFGRYYNPDRMEFGKLRVLNDDIVKGGAGFESHPHDNMEIVSIPLRGAMEHRDSMGNGTVIHTGDVQLMSAGSGIVHSEFNHSRTEDLNFLQIWVRPLERDITPRYDQKTFKRSERMNKIQTVVAPELGRNTLKINQQAWFSLAALEKGRRLEYQTHAPGVGLYAFVIEGAADVANVQLNRRDAVALSDFSEAGIEALEDCDLLLIEVPVD